MRLPHRPKEAMARALREEDHYLTAEAVGRMKREIERLQKEDRPQAVEDLRVAREMGDLSENFGYQEAKSRLNRIDNRILTLQERMKSAVVIQPGASADGRVRIGSTVVVDVGGARKTYQILGSQETNPSKGLISRSSPIGAALLGQKAGDSVAVKIQDKDVIYEIIEVS